MKREQIIKIHKQIQLKKPDFLAAWPGMGNVALGAVDYLRRMLKAEVFAEVDAGYLFAPDMVVIDNGIMELPKLPKSYFYYTQDPPMIFFESDLQIAGTNATNLLENIVDFAVKQKVKRVFTGAAYALPITHISEPEVFGVAGSEKLRDYLIGFGVRPLNEGQISGMNGLALGYAAKRNLEAVSLLATMPLYAVNLPNPKASKAIVAKLCEILAIDKIDMSEIDQAIIEVGKKMDIIAEGIKEFFPNFNGLEQKLLGGNAQADQALNPSEEKIPSHVLDRVEKLFTEAHKDKKKAYQLKAELDRWNLYRLYEDRFLNLFKEKQ